MVGEPKNGGELQRCLGSFWSRHFTGKATLRAFLDSVILAFQQTQQNLIEAQATLERQNVPLYHRELLYPLKLTYSSGDTLDYNKIKYGSGLLYGDGSSYGDLIQFIPAEITPTMATRIEARKTYRSTAVSRKPVYPLPPGLKRIGLLTNRFESPSLVLVNGIDFVIDGDVIVFSQEPFNRAEIPQLELYDSSGTHYDDEILLWATAADFDLDYVYNHLGYILGIRGKTGTVYRSVLNLVWDCLQSGMTVEKFREFLSVVSGIPISKEDETIRLIQTASLDSKLILTDKNVYTVPKDHIRDLFVGENLLKGDLLSDGIVIAESAGMDKTIPSDFDSLVLGRGFFGSEYLSVISFPNKEVDLEYLGIVNGYVKVKFEVHGFPGDIDKFWDNVHAAGVADGKTLANYLDIRENPADQPTALNLPTTVNPAQLLVSNLLGDNLILAKLKFDQFTETADKIAHLSLVRQLLPANTAFLLYVDVGESLEYISSADSTEKLDGLVVEDRGVTLTEAQAATDEFSSDVFSDYVTAKLVAGNVV